MLCGVWGGVVDHDSAKYKSAQDTFQICLSFLQIECLNCLNNRPDY